MANVKITDLDLDTAPASTDVLPFVDISSDETKKVTVEDLLESAGDGAAATPAFSFDSDKNTGIYRPGADQLALVTGGTNRLFIDSSGRLLIGTTSGDGQLEVRNSNGIISRAPSTQATDSNKAYRARNNSDTDTFSVSYKGQGYFATNLGIGTSAPTRPLHIQTSDCRIRLTDSDAPSVSVELQNISGDGVLTTNGSSTLKFSPNNSEAMRITSAGQMVIGGTSALDSDKQLTLTTTSTSGGLGILSPNNGRGDIFFGDAADDNVGQIKYSHVDDSLTIRTNAADRFTIDSSGNLGLGTTSPAAKTHISNSYSAPTGGHDSNLALIVSNSGSANNYTGIGIAAGNNAASFIHFGDTDDDNVGALNYFHDTNSLTFVTAASERLRITSAGLVGVGDSSPANTLSVLGASTAGSSSTGNVAEFAGPSNTNGFQVFVNDTNNNSGVQTKNGDAFILNPHGGNLGIGDDSPDALLVIKGNSDAATTPSIRLKDGTDTREAWITNSAGDLSLNVGGDDNVAHGTLKMFDSGILDYAQAAGSRLRVDTSGNVLVGQTSANSGNKGIRLAQSGLIIATNDGGASLLINRLTDDGDLVTFRQANTEEGSISVNGTTVSYNGAHLSRWSQLPSGAERTEILRGSVLSNIDEMCEWGEEENEQLNRMKVSDVEGDRNVAGVFQAWDDDDDTYTNDFYCAMTGDFVIRIAQGTTVARGDLLMSAGDGTAKPQDDDIIRSKTIAKVTSITVSTTYADGSYCVPCVLMAC